jgi:putative tricarboxylic transport membrane protein
VGMIAKAAGVDPGDINYIAHSGGGEAIAAILSGDVTVGVSGVGEFVDQVDAGEMRFLTVSSAEPVDGVDAPTISESGLDVVLDNWRGVMGAPDLSNEQRQAVIGVIEKMHSSPAWQDALKENGWTDFFLSGDQYEQFLQTEKTRVEGILADLGLA